MKKKILLLFLFTFCLILSACMQEQNPPQTDPPATNPPESDPPVTPPPATDPPATNPPATDPPADTPQGNDYILNTNSHKFHYPDCHSAAKISQKNKAYYTGTREELIAQGYSPCGNCDP